MFKFIFNTIFFFISIKNYLKILNGKNINNFYLPNISIKNIIFINQDLFQTAMNNFNCS